MYNLAQCQKNETNLKALANNTSGTTDEGNSSNTVNSITFYNAPFNPSVVKTNNNVQTASQRFHATLPAINCPPTPIIRSIKNPYIHSYPTQQSQSPLSYLTRSSQRSCPFHQSPHARLSKPLTLDPSPLLCQPISLPPPIIKPHDEGAIVPQKNQMQKEKQSLRLERNRIAAKECRERRKEYITRLEGRVERIEEENEVLKKKIQEANVKLELFERNTLERSELEMIVRELQEKLEGIDNA
ncbi:3066_t:CDS:2 [Acaulospora morrowiae]|uniref:3066_t:CDS:1 n=1 Tax=Acaulospora morrowiae TaxID=94023 RepID=A0A9N9H7G8_9GLOM|nr:3066_t:CDS:2 [Acaulospora morrowiae]